MDYSLETSNLIGEDALEQYNIFDLSEDDKGNLIKVIEAFENYFTSKSNESLDRHTFFYKNAINDFLTSLKKLSSTCEFGEMKDRLITDRIISGGNDKKLKDRLPRECDF